MWCFTPKNKKYIIYDVRHVKHTRHYHALKRPMLTTGLSKLPQLTDRWICCCGYSKIEVAGSETGAFCHKCWVTAVTQLIQICNLIFVFGELQCLIDIILSLSFSKFSIVDFQRKLRSTVLPKRGKYGGKEVSRGLMFKF